MEKRIFGLLPVVNRNGFMVSGVSRLDVTGSDREQGVRRGFKSEDLDAVEMIAGGSVRSHEGCVRLQHAVCRGEW